jgi:hypothetical protein
MVKVCKAKFIAYVLFMAGACSSDDESSFNSLADLCRVSSRCVVQGNHGLGKRRRL